jgi:HK97 gp10 family phage protein
MTNRMRLIGKEVAKRAYQRLPEVERAALLDEQETTAAAIATGARTRVRRRTGRLAGAIQYSVSRRLGTGKVGIVKGPVFWGHFNEFGTVKMGAQPFMRPAIEDAQVRRLERLKAVGQHIERTMSVSSSRFL